MTHKCNCDIILNSISEGVFTVDLELRITAFNRAAGVMAGVEAHEAIGKRICEVFCADSCPIAGLMKETIDTRRAIRSARVVISGEGGRPVPISLSSAALLDEAGAITGGVMTIRDLSAVENLRSRIRTRYSFEDIVSDNHKMRRILDILPDIAQSESTVLIEGPSGSGKELATRAIHRLSPRADKELVAVNCGALPDALLESELFGHRKGAFTDARSDRAGRFAKADGGTIFLDEIGDISPALQVKLLRVLQEKTYEPLGSDTPIAANVRIVAATNKDLTEETEQGRFRQDLYYRLNVVKIRLPALAERREDIPLLTEHFIERFNREKGKSVERISDNVMDLLMRYNYPGNIRELGNIIEYAFVLCHGPEIGMDHLPAELIQSPVSPAETSPAPSTTPSASTRSLEQAERQAIAEALRRHDGNRAAAAADLGVAKSTLWRKMKRYALS